MSRKIHIVSEENGETAETDKKAVRKRNPKIEIEIPGPTQILENIDSSVDRFTSSLEEIVTEIFKSRTKARIYLYLVTKGRQTSEQVSEGTGLYPSTVRDALADMHAHGFLKRTKVEREGAGKHPYIYEAIPPSRLVEAYAKTMESRLTALLNVKRLLRKESIKLPILPVTIYIGGEEAAGGKTVKDKTEAEEEEKKRKKNEKR